MKKLLFLAVVVVSAYVLVQELGISIPGVTLWPHSGDSTLQNAYNNRQSGLQVQGEGIAIKILSDDLQGLKHQRFILRLSTGQTLLVTHNIDLAPRIKQLKPMDTVAFSGEYEWNAKGGVVHWTHHDPDGRHIGGWLKHNGKIYQ